MLTKISKWSRIQDSCRITPKIESLVVCAMPDIPSKFQKDTSITFQVIVWTHRQTNKQTKTGKNITSLAEVINKSVNHSVKSDAQRKTYSFRMQVVDGLGKHLQHSTGFTLGERFLLQYPVQQLASSHQIGYHVHPRLVVIDLRTHKSDRARSAKPKFHYADFATKSGTSSRQSCGHKSWRSATQITSPTFMICVADIRDLCLLSPCNVTGQITLERHKRVCRKLVTDFVANISTCRDGLCPRLSWFVSTTFPAGKFRWKSV